MKKSIAVTLAVSAAALVTGSAFAGEKGGFDIVDEILNYAHSNPGGTLELSIDADVLRGMLQDNNVRAVRIYNGLSQSNERTVALAAVGEDGNELTPQQGEVDYIHCDYGPLIGPGYPTWVHCYEVTGQTGVPGGSTLGDAVHNRLNP